MDYEIGFGIAFMIYLFFIMLIGGAINVITQGIPLYQMAKRANLKNPWLAFVPIINTKTFLNIANISGWVFVIIIAIAFIPFVNVLTMPLALLVGVIANYRLCKHFNLGIGWFLLSLLFNGLFLWWFIFLSNKPFVGCLNPKYTN